MPIIARAAEGNPVRAKAITGAKRRARFQAALEREVRKAEAQGRRAGEHQGENRARAMLTQTIVAKGDEMVLGAVPEYDTFQVLIPARVRVGIDFAAPRYRGEDTATIAIFKSVKRYWRDPDSGQLVVWWEWQHVHSRIERGF